jgi:hypothetical protein
MALHVAGEVNGTKKRQTNVLSQRATGIELSPTSVERARCSARRKIMFTADGQLDPPQLDQQRDEINGKRPGGPTTHRDPLNLSRGSFYSCGRPPTTEARRVRIP